MRDLLVITPTRGRPWAVQRLMRAMRETCTADTQLVLGVDDDDPSYDDSYDPDWWLERGARSNCVGWSNLLARRYAGQFRYVASLGDDHVPETKGWDSQLIEVIGENGGTGIAYGDDLLQGVNAPTAPVMSSDIPQALGWFFCPQMVRLFCDNVWLDLGREAGCLFYLPDVIIRHLHYTSGLAPRDETAIAGEGTWAHDEAAYHEWQRERMAADVARVRALLSP